jgi:phage tail-like protein
MAEIVLPVGFSFFVEIIGSPEQDGSNPKFGFKEVSGINATMEVETVEEGGENRFSHKLPGKVKYDSNLELKRGLILNDSAFGQWCIDHFSKGLNVVKTGKPVQTKDLILHLVDPESRTPIMSWAFARAYPVKWEVSGFNAAQSEIIVVSLSLAYAYFIIL